MECRVCGKILARRFEGPKCKKCHAWACSAACARGVVGSHCCRMSGVSSIVSQSRACSQGIGSSGDAGSRELTQETEWVTDVQKKDEQVEDVPCDRSRLCERVAFRAKLHEPMPTAPQPCWQHPWRLRRKDPCRSIWRLCEQAKRELQDSAELRPRTLQPCSLGRRRSCYSWQRSLGRRRSCYSWQRRCQRCVPSGTSREA